MGTEKCPFCGQEIDAGAAKCFFCGAKLDEESIESRLEQLHYQEGLRSGRKIRCPVALIVMVAGILLAIVLFRGTPGGRSFSPLEHPSESSTVRLNAKVTFAGARFVISNNDTFDWENVKLEVVSVDFTEPFCLTVTRIPAGGTYTVGAAEFCRKDGTRFSQFSTRSERFRIRCDTPERGNGSYLAGWK
jgi:hypothetical protein